ncbi:MAG: hypothetical protein CL424_01450 [Acidimicrobiaceae bacterium]|nr:hypothetical protein [Acidimicrobiaceae bacterium]
MNLPTLRRVRRLAAPTLIGALALTACGSSDDEQVDSDPVSTTIPGAAGDTCLEGAADCDDTAAPADGGDPDAVDEGEFIREAEGLLGVAESELPDDVRVARRGDESFALTEDYVIGRITVELDDTDGSGYRVVTATVELTEGPQTFELTPG